MNGRISKHARAGRTTALSALCLVALSPTGAAEEAATAQRGRYLVQITGCNDCHTDGYLATGGKTAEARWLTGGRVGRQGAWGTTYATNLRLTVPHMTTQEWLRFARQPRRPPMPWFALRDMTDQDLASIYLYIRQLGPAGEAAPAFVPPGEPAKTPVITIPSVAPGH